MKGELSIDRNFLQNVTLKLGVTERNLNDINDIVHEAEKKKNSESISEQIKILENIFTNLSVLKEKQEEIERASKTALKDLTDKEAHLNRCLSKCKLSIFFFFLSLFKVNRLLFSFTFLNPSLIP